MTISTSNAPRADLATLDAAAPPTTPPAGSPARVASDLPRTIWSRFIILMLCLAVVTTTLAFGTVHSWSLGVFQLSAAVVFVLWMMDAWRTRVLRVSKNFLQLPLLGFFALGLFQLLLTGSAIPDAAGQTSGETARAFTFDPNATRIVLLQLAGLILYFSAALAFIDSPRRLRLVARLVVVFGFLLAVYGLMQHFVNPRTIFWVREPKQAEPFGPYINRHHFAGYMELVLAMPLGLLFAGAIERERVMLYAFASAIMAIALVMTNSRGGMLSMVCEILFLALVAAAVRGRRRRGEEPEDRATRVRAIATRVGLAFAMIIAVFAGVLYFGGDEALTRLLGTVDSSDPTTGRTHFWSGTVEVIKDHPLTGAGLGAFSAVYPRYDTANGNYRLEQAHNDYLQILSDGGIVGGLLGLAFVVWLFVAALRRIQTHDKMRRGIALGALSGCAGVLVHSFFDFTLHTAANGLMFLLLAALATLNGRVEEPETQGRRRRRRRRTREGYEPHEEARVMREDGAVEGVRAAGSSGAAAATMNGL
ncbi:MAG TPA: O-antigen ligase family protein [Pyrinomonadaceae bacterium]|jgi:O-antigen ligase|nr:O-antigen ligase family protein [Pyrinomonadaceae bacterium]